MPSDNRSPCSHDEMPEHWNGAAIFRFLGFRVGANTMLLCPAYELSCDNGEEISMFFTRTATTPCRHSLRPPSRRARSFSRRTTMAPATRGFVGYCTCRTSGLVSESSIAPTQSCVSRAEADLVTSMFPSATERVTLIRERVISRRRDPLPGIFARAGHEETATARNAFCCPTCWGACFGLSST